MENLRDDVSLAVCLDSTDEAALRAQGIDKVDVAIVGIGTAFEAAALTTVILKQFGVPQIIARATTSTRGQILSRIGADHIVNPERESAERWRDRLLAPAIMERSVLAEGYSMVQANAPASFHGKSLAELAVGNRYKVLIVAIRRTVTETDSEGNEHERSFVLTAPGPDTIIEPGDILVVIGSDEAIESLPHE